MSLMTKTLTTKTRFEVAPLTKHIGAELRGIDLRRRFYFLLHRQKYLTPGIDAFLALCREASAKARRSDDMVP